MYSRHFFRHFIFGKTNINNRWYMFFLFFSCLFLISSQNMYDRYFLRIYPRIPKFCSLTAFAAFCSFGIYTSDLMMDWHLFSTNVMFSQCSKLYCHLILFIYLLSHENNEKKKMHALYLQQYKSIICKKHNIYLNINECYNKL